MQQLNVYGEVTTKCPREIVLLDTVGGCSWHKCVYCEYCDTFCTTAQEAAEHNAQVLSRVTGKHHRLQVICSANFVELPFTTIQDLCHLCLEKGIIDLHVETHWIHRRTDDDMRTLFQNYGVNIHFIYGIDAFDYQRRELEWFKGYGDVSLFDLCSYAQEVNLLIGVAGQTLSEICDEIEVARIVFDRVYVYAFEPNSSPLQRDNLLLYQFYSSNYFKDNMYAKDIEFLDGLDRRAPDNLGYVGVGAQYDT